MNVFVNILIAFRFLLFIPHCILSLLIRVMNTGLKINRNLAFSLFVCNHKQLGVDFFSINIPDNCVFAGFLLV